MYDIKSKEIYNSRQVRFRSIRNCQRNLLNIDPRHDDLHLASEKPQCGEIEQTMPAHGDGNRLYLSLEDLIAWAQSQGVYVEGQGRRPSSAPQSRRSCVETTAFNEISPSNMSGMRMGLMKYLENNQDKLGELQRTSGVSEQGGISSQLMLLADKNNDGQVQVGELDKLLKRVDGPYLARGFTGQDVTDKFGKCQRGQRSSSLDQTDFNNFLKHFEIL